MLYNININNNIIWHLDYNFLYSVNGLLYMKI